MAAADKKEEVGASREDPRVHFSHFPIPPQQDKKTFPQEDKDKKQEVGASRDSHACEDPTALLQLPSLPLHSLAANLTLASFTSCILSSRVLEATASQSSYSQEPNHIGPDPEEGIAKNNVPLKNKGYTMVTENVTSI